MKNELGRKITSLTLMTIMFAGGMTIAAPSFMPEALAEDNYLYVSATSDFSGNNQFGGTQIVEIIVRDPARDAVDEEQSEPTVEVNDETLRMVQGEDGYWYAYIASTAEAAIMDGSTGSNLEIGTAESAAGVGPDVGLNKAMSITGTNGLSVSSSATIYSSIADVRDTSAPTMSSFGTAPSETRGQLNVTTLDWPFIQTWEFADDDTVTIVLEKAGEDESVTLDFEGGGTDDYAYVELDRNSGPAGGQVHMTIYDPQLNHDPTQEDTVAFLTNGTYGVSFNVSATFSAYLASDFGDNGKLIIDYDAASSGTPVLAHQDNADCSVQALVSTESADANASGLSGYHCFTETGSNTGIFTNTDDADVSTLKVSASALRGTTASVDYNDAAQSILVTTTAGTIDMAEGDAGDEWNSGESITVTLVDPDRNLNTASDEDLTVATTANVPTITIGSPVNPVQGTTGSTTLTDANMTLTHVHGTSGIVTFLAEHDGTEGTDADDGAIWTIDTGLTADNVNSFNSSMVQRYVALDVSSFCTDSTIEIAGKAASQTNKGVISYGTADLTAAQTDLKCRVDHDTVPQTLGTTTSTGFITFMAFGPEDNHGQYRVEIGRAHV